MKKFSRTKLYNELLTNTLKDLSEKYHVNYAKFSAFCHQNNIPIPGSKYRMYLKMNRDVTGLVEPLPTAKNDIIYFETEDDKDTDIASELKDLNDSQKIKQIEQVLANFKYSSKKPLSNKVKNFKKSVKEWEESNPGDIHTYEWYEGYSYEQKPKFMDNISSKEMPRLYRILDEIYLVLDQLGEEVKDDFTVIIGGKDEVPFDVLELKDRVKHEITKEEQKDLDEYEIDLKIRPYSAFKPRIRKYDHPYNGKLKIEFKDYPYHAYVKDTNKGQLEDKISEIIINFYKEYISVRNERLEREYEERKRKEEKERKNQKAKHVNDEKTRVKKLVTEAYDYQTAMRIRKYAAVISDGKYKDWALQKADWLDPTVAKDDEILKSRDYSKDLKEYLDDLLKIEDEYDW